jgi:hypothetical protein
MTPNGPAIKALVGMTKDKSHKIKVKKSKSCLARFTRCHARPARHSLGSLNEQSMAQILPSRCKFFSFTSSGAVTMMYSYAVFS